MSGYKRILAGLLSALFLVNLTGFASARGSDAPLSDWRQRGFSARVNDIAFDARRNVVLGTVRSSESFNGGQLREFSPRTALPEGRSVYVGSEPGPIDISDDFSTAYIGSYETNQVVRVDLETFKITDRFSVGIDPVVGPLAVDDIEVSPGTNDTVAVSLRGLFHRLRQDGGVKLFKNGQVLPGAIPPVTYLQPARLAFVDGSTLVTSIGPAGSETLRFLRFDDSGLTPDPARPPVEKAGSSPKVKNGRIYTSAGKVFDAESAQVVWTFPPPPTNRPFEVTGSGRLFVQYEKQISVYDTATGELIDSRQDFHVGSSNLVETNDGMATNSLTVSGPDVPPGEVPHETKAGPIRALGGPGVRELNVGANDLVYDAPRDRLYASVPSTDRGYADELVVIDPRSGLVYERMQLSDDPGPIAMTSDGSRLYVGLNRTGEVKHVDLDTLTVKGAFQTTGGAAPVPNWDLEVVPGSLDTLAVSGGPDNRISIFKSGVALPVVVTSGPLQMAFGDAVTLYGLTADLYNMSVGPEGVSVTKVIRNVQYQWRSTKVPPQGKVSVYDGLVVTSDGALVDPETGDREVFYGGDGRPGENRGSGTAAAVPALGRFYTIIGPELVEYDLREQRFLGTWPIVSGHWRQIVGTGTGIAAASPEQVLISGNDTRISTWGWNGFAQLGTGFYTPALRNSPRTARMFGAEEIAAGFVHNLYTNSWDHRLEGWGAGGSNGAPFGAHMPVDVTITRDSIPTVFSAGLLHSAAINPEGYVFTWGWNGAGQLGDGSLDDSFTPTGPSIGDAVGVAAGGLHSLALLEDGTVLAWGSNEHGQIGDGSGVNALSPAKVPGLRDVVAVSAGAFHSLAVHSDGTVSAWGWNGLGQLGDGTTIDRPTPVKVAGLAGIKNVSAGYAHNVAMGVDGRVKAWGWNPFGQLGDGSTTDRLTPVPVKGLPAGVDGLSAGSFHTMALRDGVTYSWGWNVLGQLGDGTFTDRLTPVIIKGVPDAYHVAAGGFHSMVARVTASTWGGTYPEPGVPGPSGKDGF